MWAIQAIGGMVTVLPKQKFSMHLSAVHSSSTGDICCGFQVVTARVKNKKMTKPFLKTNKTQMSEHFLP